MRRNKRPILLSASGTPQNDPPQVLDLELAHKRCNDGASTTQCLSIILPTIRSDIEDLLDVAKIEEAEI